MLDKTVPYHDLLMCRQAGTPLPTATLPVGFSLVNFRPGDELAWAAIETSVIEFDNQAEAISFFRGKFMPYPAELERRLFFLQDPNGEYVGTFTAWWGYTDKRRIAVLHWVGLKPEYQGQGLGKALISSAMQEFLAIEGDVDIYLHTQTWSYRAVGIYLWAGFSLLRTGTFGAHTANGYLQALPILQEKMPERYLRML